MQMVRPDGAAVDMRACANDAPNGGLPLLPLRLPVLWLPPLRVVILRPPLLLVLLLPPLLLALLLPRLLLV